MTPQVLSILEKHYSEGFHLAQLQTFIAALQTSPEKSVTLNFVTNPAAVGRTENKYVDGIFVICSLNYSPPPLQIRIVVHVSVRHRRPCL